MHAAAGDAVRAHRDAKLSGVTDGHRTSTIPRPRIRNGGAPTRSAKGKRVRNIRSGGAGSIRPVPGPVERHGLLDDLTTPIARDKQIMPQRRGKLLLGAVATLIALAIGAALFVLPVKSWMKQRDELAVRTSELQTLNAANNQLQSEVDRLQTDDGIREAARTEIDYVPEGEKRVTVLPLPAASTALPSGWPYNLITSILSIRQAEATAAASAATAVVPTSQG